MKNRIIILLCLSSIFFNRGLYAESTGYEVEVIVFSYTGNPYLASENWPEISIDKPVEELPVEEELTTDIEVTPQTFEPATDSVIIDAITNEETEINQQEISAEPELFDYTKEAEFLSKDLYRLNKQAEALEKNSRYKLMIHKAWKQAGLAKDEAFPVHLKSEQDESVNEDIQTQKEISTTQIQAENENLTEGDITLVMTRYLHINADFEFYTVQTVITENGDDLIPESIEKKYMIHLERRMKSKEVNFIDHPLMGILVLATPFKILSPEDLEEPVKNTYKTL